MGLTAVLDEGWLAFDTVKVTSLSAPITAQPEQYHKLTAQVNGQLNSAGDGRLFVQYSDGTIGYEWQNGGVFNGSQNVNGNFTTPANVSSFQVGTEVVLDKGYLAFDDLTLTAYSNYIAVVPLDLHRLTAQITGELDAGFGQGGQIWVVYENLAGQTLSSTLLWSNPADFSGMATMQADFNPGLLPPTVVIRMALETNLDAGYLAFSDFDLAHLDSGDIIRRSTYSVAGQSIAVKVAGDPDGNNGLFFLYSDHLGSANAMRRPDGSVTQTRYLPFGGYRGGSGGNPITDRGYTGHKHNDSLGLIYMNARYYVVGISRFASADILVPDPTNPQQFNRYTYSLNNPVTFFDPSGHRTCSAQEAQNDFETCDQNLGAGSDYGNVNLFNNAFPYFFVGAMKRAVQQGFQGSDNLPLTGQAIYDEMFKQASDDTAAYVTNAFGNDNLLAQAMAEVFSNGSGSTRPSDFLGNDVAFVIAAAYMADAARMGQLAQLLSSQTPTGMPCSFSANTLVMTSDGLILISQITWGTMVLAYNEETGEIGYYPVIATWSHEDPVIVFLTIDGETIVTTPNHPFFTRESEWVEAGNLQIGDKIRDAAWGVGTVETITYAVTPQTMYNFTVATAHTYFVGDGQWLVHNQCGGYFKGTDKPWTTGATPNSAYTRFNSRTGQPIQTAIYDSQGRVIVHIDWKMSGNAPVGHWHYLKVPGDPASGHGPNNPHYQPINPSTWGLPPNWNTWP